MINRYLYKPGDIVKLRDRAINDPMAFYVFREWSGVPEHPKGGRIAILTWCYNGTDASSWEADLAPICIDRDALRTLIAGHHATNPSSRATPCVA